MTQVDDMFINYYDSKKVKRILTPDGYTIDKEGYEHLWCYTCRGRTRS